MHALIIAVTLLALASSAVSQPATDAVVLTKFRGRALAVGTEEEDWQPAFQAAIAKARETGQPVYVPAGEYKIRQAISIVPPNIEGKPWFGQSIRMFGAGQYHSIILQQVETENCIDWTGLTYEESANRGSLEELCLSGGKITLNIKWHNYFTLDSCYIRGAAEYGVYAEGWTSRFLNSTIRWCRVAGICGRAHFNNCVIRDCYFSRDGVGIMLSGVHGSRIEGCGLERCSKAAIYARGIRGLTINNSYFEGNGYKDSPHLPVEGHANTIHLDFSCNAIRIHDCIFRANLDPEGALLSIADCRHGHIYDNYFYCGSERENGIKLRAKAETSPDSNTYIIRMTVERNWFEGVKHPLSEEVPGLYKRALGSGCSFDAELSALAGSVDG